MMKNREEFINNKKEFNEKEGDPKKSWNEAKRQMYGDNNQIPERLIENEKMKVGSKNVANVLNRYYVSKIRKIKEKMKKGDSDPMISYRK